MCNTVVCNGSFLSGGEMLNVKYQHGYNHFDRDRVIKIMMNMNGRIFTMYVYNVKGCYTMPAAHKHAACTVGQLTVNNLKAVWRRKTGLCSLGVSCFCQNFHNFNVEVKNYSS